MENVIDPCMEKCKAKYAKYLAPSVPNKGETKDEADLRVKRPLIDKLISSGCGREGDRSRFEGTTMTALGLVVELCACECANHFPFK